MCAKAPRQEAQKRWWRHPQSLVRGAHILEKLCEPGRCVWVCCFQGRTEGDCFSVGMIDAGLSAFTHLMAHLILTPTEDLHVICCSLTNEAQTGSLRPQLLSGVHGGCITLPSGEVAPPVLRPLFSSPVSFLWLP